MKPLLITILLLILPMVCQAQEIDLAIIATIESSNNPLAYNKVSQARGLYQITPICLKEYNQWHTSAKIPLNALYKPVEARKMAKWYLAIRIPQMLKYYGISVTIDNILWAYNTGISKVVKGIKPQETINYINKYHKLNAS